jgi:hypothetical protein
MSIPTYKGETCVAFLDACGFTSKMQEGLRVAACFLDKFYTRMYNVARDFNIENGPGGMHVRSLIVSDCAVIFVDNSSLDKNMQRDLRVMLRFIKRINRDLINQEPDLRIMTTCSVDYGKFKYEKRIGFDVAEKTYFLGEPYVRAVLDDKLKKRTAKCRVLAKATDQEPDFRWVETFEMENPDLILRIRRKNLCFYWMLNNRASIRNFDKEYAAANRILGQAKYSEIIRVLRKYIIEEDHARSSRSQPET